LIGVLCGLVGALFSKSISAVTHIREQNFWLIYLLPVAGVITAILYKLAKIQNIGTKDVIKSAKGEKNTPLLLAPLMFVATALTHLSGGSAGKEGAALQIGGGLSAAVSKIFRLNQKVQKTLTLCGMSALFSAVFGTPLAAAVFSIEVIRPKRERLWEIVPTAVASFCGFFVAKGLGTEAVRFYIEGLKTISLQTVFYFTLIAIFSAIIGFLFCKVLSTVSGLAKRFIKNDVLRVFVGGLLVIAITFLIGSTRYNGSGLSAIHGVFENSYVKKEDFILKLILTAITVGFGFKGGEIIPSVFIGATFGGAVASILGISVPLGGAVGVSAMFCAVTKCPIATMFICTEMFGGKASLLLIISVIIGRFFSGRESLYGKIPPIFGTKQ
jgi:H+/Cl- antiporter ClcA